jgi:hypothetical protein
MQTIALDKNDYNRVQVGLNFASWAAPRKCKNKFHFFLLFHSA